VIGTLERNGAKPPIAGDTASWLDALTSRVGHDFVSMRNGFAQCGYNGEPSAC
jgi:hypothetical protein